MEATIQAALSRGAVMATVSTTALLMVPTIEEIGVMGSRKARAYLPLLMEQSLRESSRVV